jgi:hypothetical protein
VSVIRAQLHQLLQQLVRLPAGHPTLSPPLIEDPMAGDPKLLRFLIRRNTLRAALRIGTDCGIAERPEHTAIEQMRSPAPIPMCGRLPELHRVSALWTDDIVSVADFLNRLVHHYSNSRNMMISIATAQPAIISSTNQMLVYHLLAIKEVFFSRFNLNIHQSSTTSGGTQVTAIRMNSYRSRIEMAERFRSPGSLG